MNSLVLFMCCVTDLTNFDWNGWLFKSVKIVSFRNYILLNLFWANDNVESWSCNSMAVTVITRCWKCSVSFLKTFWERVTFLCISLFMQRCYHLSGINITSAAATKTGLLVHQVLITFCWLVFCTIDHPKQRDFFNKLFCCNNVVH